MRPVPQADLPAGVVGISGRPPRAASVGMRGVRIQIRDTRLLSRIARSRQQLVGWLERQIGRQSDLRAIPITGSQPKNLMGIAARSDLSDLALILGTSE